MEEVIQDLCQDTRDFWQPLSTITRVDARTLSALEFYRSYVSKSIPVILTHALESPQWQHVLIKWQTMDYLLQQAGDVMVTVDVTPFGYGDAVLEVENEEYFVMPEEQTMTLRAFMELLNDHTLIDGVPYLSHQNDSLRTELPQLFAGVPTSLPLACEAFGNDPEAINLWIGDERAVSTMHKDHYENMYGVVKGKKHFTLLPPSAIACLYETEYVSARYAHVSTTVPSSDKDDRWIHATRAFHDKYPTHTSWHLLPASTTTDLTPWIPVDPLHIDRIKYPLATLLSPIQCIIESGEVLYLPAMWYHRATQLETTISINYWHDMSFDCRYVYYNFVSAMAQQIRKVEEEENEYRRQ